MPDPMTAQPARPRHAGLSVMALPLRWRLVAVGVVGLALTVFVLQSAISSFSAESRARAAAGRIGLAERFHQDADQAHDAMHADVLDVLRIVRAGDPKRAESALAVLERDTRVYRHNMDRVDAMRLGGSVGKALVTLRPAQLEYAASGVRLGRLAVSDAAAADTQLAAFDGAFLRLVRAQGSVTAELADQVEATRAEADAIQRSAEHRIVTACLIAMAVLILLSVVLARLGERLARLAKRERGVAETLARSMLPETLPQLPGLAMAARYLPTGRGNEIGGDWYDVMLLDDGKLAVMLGDVLGHDMAAAAVMGQLRIAGRAYALEGMAPVEVMGKLNALLLSLGSAPMATCLYLQVDLLAGEASAVGAGHPWPLVIAEGTCEVATMPPGPPLGALRNAEYRARRIDIPPGSTLLLYTDGLIERRGESFDVGLARLTHAVSRPSEPGHWLAGDPDRLCDALLADFFSDADPADDVALLALTFDARPADTLTLRYDARPEVVPDLRHTLGRWLTAAGADDAERFDLTVAVAEAASNAVEHAYGPATGATFVLSCTLRDDAVEIAVTDTGSWRPARGHFRGNGQRLMRQLCDDVRVDTGADGTTVTLTRRLHTATMSAAGALATNSSA
jgi:serine phosphatase RsbU (regulator of sigma subunit)/anti-sigma regulatory factor (Ser/Thr protein kinase)